MTNFSDVNGEARSSNPEFDFDEARLLLQHKDKVVELTRLENRLLSVLAAKAGGWVSADTVGQLVWMKPFGGDVSSFTTSALVTRLRRKLRTAGMPLEIRMSKTHGLMMTTRTDRKGSR